MPGESVHQQQAVHNRNFFTEFRLAQSDYTDWAATVLFYTALHLVEAFLASRGEHSPDHRQRDQNFVRFAELRPLYSPYRELKHHSQRARYYGARFDSVTLDKLRAHLNTIEEHL
jgi:hypothetical protein